MEVWGSGNGRSGPLSGHDATIYQPMGHPPATYERIGHRGAPTEYAENSLPSFKQAFALGADAVELDVHATADGVVVVHHDAAIGGGALTTRFRGREINELNWADVETIELPGDARIPT